MLKSTSGLALRADRLIASWDSWSNGPLQDVLATWNGPKKVGHIRAAQSQATSYRDQTRAILADAAAASKPNAPALPQDVLDDLTAIAEELDLAIADMDAETDPEKKFSASDHQAKLDATAGMLVDSATVEKFKARASGKSRGQVAPKPNPPGQIK
jgi:hypothetical protein